MRTYLKVLVVTAALIAAAGQGHPGRAAASSLATGAGVPPPPGVVSAVPASNTPELNPAANNPVQQIRQLVQCGGTMYAVGSFTQILQGGTTYPRTDIFSFQASPPYTVTSWAPSVVGTTGTTAGTGDAINSITFVGGNCADAYVGGDFSSINGTSVKKIAEISTSTGNVVTAFAHSAAASVQTLLGYGSHVLAGGYFKSINGSSTDPYFVSLNPTTGRDDGFIHLNISGNYQYPGVGSNVTKVYNQALSHSGTLDLVMGDFTSVGGLPRQQIFMLNLAGPVATVTGWTSPEWDGSAGNLPNGYPYQCADVEPFYLQAAAWSPDDSTIYIGTTGFHPWNQPTGATPRTGLCDAAAAFPSTQTKVLHKWINYTGCDSLFAAAADANGSYFGGHERWSMNPDDCNAMGPGAVKAPGLEGLDPATGNVFLNSGQTAGYYSRDRGLGADDMLLTSAGLWVASDNFEGSQMCGGVKNLSGICFLPYGG